MVHGPSPRGNELSGSTSEEGRRSSLPDEDAVHGVDDGEGVSTRALEADMAVDTDTRVLNGAPMPYVDRRLIGGSAVLVTGGLLACVVGAAVGVVAVVGACRRYVADLDESPRATVRRRWGQVRSASAAGVGAWQDYDRAR
jgi:hypothetical protein